MYNEADSDANETLTVKLISSNINILKSWLHVFAFARASNSNKPNSKLIPLDTDITWS